jgi:large subunit ribosomal protein L3
MLKRSRASSEIPRIRNWPNKPGILGFAAYKAGITHALIIDSNKKSRTAGKEVSIPVTVLECPPLFVAGFRGYQTTPYGFKVSGEVWADKLPKHIDRAIRIRQKGTSADQLKKFEKVSNTLTFIRLITSTQPDKVSGLPKKEPDIMEQAIGGSVTDQLIKAKDVLGKELSIADVFKGGETIDAFAVSKGKGFQGVIKRFGAKLQKRKTETTRKIGTLGARTPSKVSWRTPMAGQMGYQQRFSLNHMIVKFSEPITPKGGWPNYGVCNNNCVLIRGSLPGPINRLIRLRKSIRKDYDFSAPEMTYLSLEAKN